MDFDLAAIAHAYAAAVEDYTARFGDEFQTNDLDRALLASLVERCPQRGTVLDIGCGPGQVSAFVAARGRSAIAIDVTFEMLVVAHRRGPTTALVRGDVQHLALAGASCDAAACWYSLHNLPGSALPSALRELRRAVRAGAQLLVATHSGRGAEWHDGQWQGRHERVVVTYYAPDELAGLIHDAGFHDLEIRTRPPRREEHQVDKVYVTATAG